MAPQPGWKSTEFYLTVLVIIAVMLSTKLGITSEQLYIILGAAGIYTGGRSFTKAQASKGGA